MGKRCSTCHEEKPLSDYNVRRAAPDGLQARCRACARQWYVDNRTEHRRNVAARNARVLVERRQFICEYLLDHPCVDCGEVDITVLEFDHPLGVEKVGNVMTMALELRSWPAVLVEMAKCEVRCANCHRRLTGERAGWYRTEVQRLVADQRRADAVARLSSLQTRTA